MKTLSSDPTPNGSDCQVLVVGAGPTGLTLACELLAKGVRTRIIDRADGAVLETRASGMHARTLEVFEQMGLADRMLERGHPVRHFSVYSSGRRMMRLDLSRNGSRYGYMLSIPQHETERVLRARIAELGGLVEQQMELISFVEQPDAVLATVRSGSGELSTIRSGYIVGCDGAHSQVRHQLGLPFSGHPYPQDWLLADVRLDWQRSEDSVHALFGRRNGAMIAFPMREHRWRLVFPFTGDRGEDAPTLEEIQRLADARCPERVRISDPTWLAVFRCHRRSTNRYRVGRALLAGDAVHIHTPAGGQGMNTGVMDAHNIGWKLALVASGRAGEWLLDTVAAERGPVAHDVLQLTHALVRLGTLNKRWQQLLRDLLLPVASRVPALQRRAARRLGHIGVAYAASRLTIGGCGGGRVHELPELKERRHVLLVPGGAEPPASLRPYVDLLTLACAPTGRPTALVRPDGYLAALGVADVEAYFRQLCADEEAADISSTEPAAAAA
jgi:2-polyprenyl-6-methoxyphenol hydroxylase-like FAD-dependent oxidoreductase